MATETGARSRFSGVVAGLDYNTLGGGFFATWGLLHVVVGAIGLALFATGTAPMLSFVDLDAAVNAESARMAQLVVQFYQALLLIGLTVTVLGLTLNRRGDPVGLALNTVLVAGIDVFFIYFEVLPGHRPVPVGIISIALFVLGVVCCWRGLRQ